MPDMPPQRLPLDPEFFCDGPYYLETEPPMSRLVSEIGWCGEFEFRRPELG